MAINKAARTVGTAIVTGSCQASAASADPVPESAVGAAAVEVPVVAMARVLGNSANGGRVRGANALVSSTRVVVVDLRDVDNGRGSGDINGGVDGEGCGAVGSTEVGVGIIVINGTGVVG